MLKQQLINPSKYGIKCPYPMTPKGICIHNTANDASAQNEANYMQGNNLEVSFHIVVDDVEAIQCLPLDRNAWATGDGGYGEGNRNYVQVEICYSRSGGDRFINAEKRAAKEVAALLKQYGWGINNVKKHQDFSGKYCPHRTLDMGWQRFLNMVQAELNGSTEVKQATVQQAPVKSTPSTGEYTIKEYPESGVFTCTVDAINFRNKPYVGSDNPITGQYYRNETVNYDYVVITNKYTWISWISASTGIRRYMPITDRSINEKWGYCV